MSGRAFLSRSKLAASKLVPRMSNITYEDAVQKLNSLQSNKSAIECIRKEIRAGEQKCTNIEDMENYLLRTGQTLSELDKLSVIHVAGTKGKGSTSAMCESVLRQHGFRTGFYSSPHLVAVRERIRLEGRVIGKEQFAKHFCDVYDLLDCSKAHEGDMPGYFAFLTVLAFNVFLKEKVDVAIVEVGIGGIVDYTNVLRYDEKKEKIIELETSGVFWFRDSPISHLIYYNLIDGGEIYLGIFTNPPVVGITALGLDHTSILGSTIEEIASAKAGIMKPGCRAYTVQQPPAAMDVLQRVAKDVQCPLYVVPDYKKYEFPPDCKNHLPIDLYSYYTNASLAVQLAHAWMRLRRSPSANKAVSLKKQMNGNMEPKNGFTKLIDDNVEVAEAIVKTIPVETVVGLKECKWPGRYQIIKADYANFYFDGAHTKESMEICANWFATQVINRSQMKVLIFSATGDRDSELLLKPLVTLSFHKVYFVIPTAYKEVNNKNDNYSISEQRELISRCHSHADIWKLLDNSNKTESSILESVSEALIDIKKTSNSPLVLITGSLHLVGAALSILDSNVSSN